MPAGLRLQRLQELRSSAPELHVEAGCQSHHGCQDVVAVPRQVVETLASLGEVQNVPFGSILLRSAKTFRWTMSRKCRNKSAHVSNGNTATGRALCIAVLLLRVR